MEQDLGTWQPPDASGLARIEYSLAVMEELRLYAEEGFQKIPHGGIEVGALLLGERPAEGRGVRILEWRPMACDHARGPGFTLSDGDRDALRAQILRCTHAEELKGLEVVGWCHTHTRSKIFLSLEDMAIHQVYFSEPWQIAMVIRPQKDQPALAGFFARDTAGQMQTESSALEIPLLPDVSQTLKPKRSTAAPGGGEAGRLTAGRPDVLSSPGRPMRHERERGLRPPQQHHHLGASERPLFGAQPDPPPSMAAAASAGAVPSFGMNGGSIPAQAAPSGGVMHFPEAALGAPIPHAGSVAAGAAPGFPRRAVWAGLALLAAAAVGTGSYLWSLDQSGKIAALKVEESDRNSLMISWDHTSPLVSGADRGMLRIMDGGIERKVPLSYGLVRAGSVTYMREADDVDIRLSLYRDDRLMGQESAHFVGSSPLAPTVTSSINEDAPALSIDERRLQLQTEVTRLREVLREESNKTERLKEELTLLERTAAAANVPRVPRNRGR